MSAKAVAAAPPEDCPPAMDVASLLAESGTSWAEGCVMRAVAALLICLSVGLWAMMPDSV